MRQVPQWRWHLDEVFVKIRGETHYLWRAVDHEGKVLEAYIGLPNATSPTVVLELAVGIEAAFMQPLPHSKAA